MLGNLGLADAAVHLASLYRLADEALAELRPDWLPCQAGCAWCCWGMNSLVTWVEAYWALLPVQGWLPADKADLLRRARAEVTLLLTDRDIAQAATGSEPVQPETMDKFKAAARKHLRACPLLNLQTGQCRVYGQRFMACHLFGQASFRGRKPGEGYLYGCDVVVADADAHPEVRVREASDFVKALYVMAGGGACGTLNVYMLPIAFWIDALGQGGTEGREYSLDNIEPLFARFLNMFQPLDVEVKNANPDNGQTPLEFKTQM